MPDTITAIAAGRLTLSRISYHCDLQRDSGSIIPLGSLAELTFNGVRILGLVARTSLFDHELGAIGALVRPRLVNPFETLSDEFKWAWQCTKAGEALDALAGRHSSSLFVSPPKIVTRAFQASVESAKEELRRERDQEFLELLVEAWSKPKTVPQEEMARLAA